MAGGLFVRRSVARWFGMLAAGAIVASFMVFATAAPASAAGENTILTLINRDRAAVGLGPLKFNAAINAVALAWAKTMAANDSMVHNPDYSSQIPTGWTRAGENIARGFPTPEAVHDAWMHSTGHRANILGDYTDVGIAFITVDGTTWAVEDFAKYGTTSAPATPKPKKPPAPSSPARPSTQDWSLTQQGSPSSTPEKSPAESDPARAARIPHEIDLSLLPDEEPTSVPPSTPDAAENRSTRPGQDTDANPSGEPRNSLSLVAAMWHSGPGLGGVVLGGAGLAGLVLAAGAVTGARLRRRWRRG
ncbi:CAP domain-containing protein [Terrimesophilobacter mesophilus]|nr:CAP domain-containing protein [Terrimesophilobacter mesophilus]